jgi:hypothetical protein
MRGCADTTHKHDGQDSQEEESWTPSTPGRSKELNEKLTFSAIQKLNPPVVYNTASLHDALMLIATHEKVGCKTAFMMPSCS